MAANQDKVEEKVEKELDEMIKAGKSQKEIEKELDVRDVSYKLKDKTEH
ncbi:MAG: hypothetical protein AB1351_10385 [Thermoproteota archaeon]